MSGTPKILRPELPRAAAPAVSGPSRWQRWLPHLSAVALFGFLAIAMTWPLAHNLRHHLVSWGDPVFQAWTMAWDLRALATAPLHVFDANIFYPYRNTLAYSDYLFGQAAMIAPVLIATGNAILADNFSVLLALMLSGFAMYLLVVDITGNRLAGIAAGAAFAFAPPRMAHLEHLHLLSAEWLPLAVVAGRRALRQNSWRWAAALGVVVFLQGLFGLYYFYFMVVLLLVVVSSYLIAHRARPTLVATAKVGVGCAVAAVLLLPMLLPYEQVSQDLGVERTVAEVEQWSADPSDYLAVNPDNRLYGPRLAPRYHRDLERDLFPGLLLLLLGIVGLFNRRIRWERWLLFALTILAVLLSFGPVWHIAGREIPSPYLIFYDFLPGFKAIRVPARMALLALVGLAALAGLGVDLVLRHLKVRLPNRGTVLSFGLTGLLGASILAEGSVVMPLAGALPASLAEANRPDYAWMAQHPAPAIELPMGEGIIASAWPNFWSIYHWNPVVNGYSAFAPPAYYVFRDRMRDFPSADTIRLLQGIGVRTVVYHSDPSVPAGADPVLSKVSAFPQLTQVVGGPDYVWELAPEPWMWDLAESVPRGQNVDLPDLPSDPATFGMLAAILQRTDHTVYGRGTLQYWRLPEAPASTCYAILPQTGASLPDRYRDAEPVRSAGDLTVYRLRSCAAP